MKHFFAIILTLLFLSAVWSQSPPDYYGVLGQERINTINTAVSFLMIGPDARAGALGEAGVSSSPDINSMHWNPAKYAFFMADDFYEIDDNTGDTLAIKDYLFSAGLNYTPWLRAIMPDMNLLNVVGVYRPDNKQALAVSLKYFSLGDVNFRDEVGTHVGTVKPREFAFDVAYARKLSASFSSAVAFRWIYSDLTQGWLEHAQAGVSIAADVALYYRRELRRGSTPTTLAAGLNISNMGNKMTYTDEINAVVIPTNLCLGSSLTFDIDNLPLVSG